MLLYSKFYIVLRKSNVVNQKGMKEKVSVMGAWCGQKNSSLGITVRHRGASLVMPISDPRDRFFYPDQTTVIDTNNHSSFGLLGFLLMLLSTVPLTNHSTLVYTMNDDK